MSGIINIDSPTGHLSTRSEEAKSVSPAQYQPLVSMSPFASPTPWNATTGSATTGFSPWRQTPDSKSSHHWSTASTASGDRSAVAAQSPPWSTTATPSSFSFVSSKEAEKEARVARAPWNQGDDSTTSQGFSPMMTGSGLLDAPMSGNSPAMVPPPPPPRVATGLPYSSPAIPGKYWVEDEFGVAVQETVIWTGVTLRKPDLRNDPTRRLVIQGPSAQQLYQRKKNAATKRSPMKHSPKVQTSPSVGTPGASSFSAGSTPGSRTISSPNVGL